MRLAWLFWLLLSGGVLEACTCMMHVPVCEAYWQGSAVFAGSVTQISSVPGRETDEHGRRTYPQRVVHFSVEKNYRGGLGGEVQLSTGMGGADCGYGFQLGERYLVYADTNEETHELRTSSCSSTKLLANAKDDLEYIAGLSKEPAGTRLFGSVPDATRSKPGRPSVNEKLAGVAIGIKSPGGMRRTVSDKEGRFELKGLPAGTYEMRAELFSYVGLIPKMSFPLPAQGCFAIEVPLEANGQIEGRVSDDQGNALAHQEVELTDAEENSLVELRTETNDEGRYQFSGVRPGDFLIGVNLSGPPNEKNPFLRTFFPNAPKRENAAVVHLAKAGKLSGQDLFLSRRTKYRSFQGVVVWPDGTPAAKATVNLTYADYPGQMGSNPGPDAQGQFSGQALTNVPTKLWVQAQNAAGVWMNAGEVNLSLEGPIPAMRLILNHESVPWKPPQ